MERYRPYLLDLLLGAVCLLLPGIRGYSNWQIHEFALLFLIYAYIVYRNHKK